MGSIIGLIILALNIYSVIILARVLLTWLPNVDRNNAGVRFLHDATEPVLRPIRDMLPQNSGIDFSPLVVMLSLSLVTMLLRML